MKTLPDRKPMESRQSFAIIPAAGHSRRMGTDKLLLPFRGATVIEHVVHQWQASRVGRIVVVLRADDRSLQRVLSPLEIDLVLAAPPPAEMKHSVQRGLHWINEHYAPEPTDRWLLAPADSPRLSTAVVNQLLALDDDPRHSIWAPVHEGRRGHPVQFAWHIAGQVDRLSANEGVNALLGRLPWRPMEVSDPAILEDLDTPEDYRRLQNETPDRRTGEE